ncbi:MAG: hypothetical protein JWM34_122 [Ilumatobacteraceae bacterium]|nr:hypothetical protein [Ilumatobacteraceae bacterium]
MGTRGWRAVAISSLVFAASACTEHTVGPARTFDDFERKSRTTAEVALSAVETVRLLAETADAGKAFGSYTTISIGEQEDTLSSAVGDFSSVQPPDQHADDLRAQLEQLLSDATDHLTAVRVAVRRGTLEGLADVAAPLAADSTALRTFLAGLS